MPSSDSSTLHSLSDNLEVLITSLVYMGTAYNPVPTRLKLTSLQTRLATVKALFNDVSLAESALDAVIQPRAAAFDHLDDRVTRAQNTLKALSPKSPVLNAVKKTVRELRGQRATDPPLNPDGTPADSNSVAKTTYKDLVDSFGKLINDLAKDPLYAPAPPEAGSTEPDMTLAGLAAFRDDLSSKNSAVTNARIPLENARAARDAALFDEEDGLVVVCQQVKTWVKGKFGVKSPQYKQIHGLSFKKLK